MKTNANISLGSLFDGIGGFPYAASFYGIKPLWASEILPAAISITRRHFPDMLHLGDISKLNGGKIPPVDIITFGSPCQGLSAAGRRLGFADERSALFKEAIRIIDEMRCATNGQYPKLATWENVTGAFSSNGGLDFKAVLEAFTSSDVPLPQSGKWANSGMVRSAGADIAWVVYNAQHFGVPQRRRRIFLIADFTGKRAGEILFIPKSLRGYLAQSGTTRQNFATVALGSIGSGIEVLNDQGGNSITVERGECSPTLRCMTHGNLPIIAAEIAVSERPIIGMGSTDSTAENCVGFVFQNHRSDARYTGPHSVAPTITAMYGTGGNNTALTIEGSHIQAFSLSSEESNFMKSDNQHSGYRMTDTARTLDTTVPCPSKNQGGIAIVEKTKIFSQRRSDEYCDTDVASTQVARQYKSATDLVCIVDAKSLEEPLCEAYTYCLQGSMIERQDKNGPQGSGINTDTCFTLNTVDRHAVAFVDCRNMKEVGQISGTLCAKNRGGYSLNYQNPVRIRYKVRRLTPLECERLQGFPDGWTETGCNGKTISDSARYQMLGNSVAVPCVAYIMAGIAQQLEESK